MAMSGLKGLLEMVGFEVTMEGVWTGTHSESWGRKFQILEAPTLKVRAAEHQVKCRQVR